MKTLQKLLFLTLIIQLCSGMLAAQSDNRLRSSKSEKNFSFSQLPENFECPQQVLRAIFNAALKEEIRIPLPGNQFFTGTVVARVQQEKRILSMNVISSNFPGAMLNLSLITQEDGSERMLGRILNPRSGDVLVIRQSGKSYTISRELQKFVMTDCPLPDMAFNQPEHL